MARRGKGNVSSGSLPGMSKKKKRRLAPKTHTGNFDDERGDMTPGAKGKKPNNHPFPASGLNAKK